MDTSWKAALAGIMLAMGSTSALAWQPTCKTDQMTDKQICTITDFDAGVMVYYGSSVEPEAICIFKHDFPGRDGAIRIDSNTAIEAPGGCARPQPLMKQMLKGKFIRTRYYEWPYDFGKDGQGFLRGFAAAVSKMQQMQSGLR